MYSVLNLIIHAPNHTPYSTMINVTFEYKYGFRVQIMGLTCDLNS